MANILLSIRFLLEFVIWFSFIWSLIRTFLTLIEDKSIHRNRAEQITVQNLLRKEGENKEQEEENCCQTACKYIKDKCLILVLKLRYLGIPLIKAMPTVLFRMLCFWLLLSYSTEFYPDEKGTGPGLGLWFPFVMMMIVIGINFGIGYLLGLKTEEGITNSITNLVIPVYLDVFFLVNFVLNFSIH